MMQRRIRLILIVICFLAAAFFITAAAPAKERCARETTGETARETTPRRFG